MKRMLRGLNAAILAMGLGVAALPASAQVTPDNFVGGRVADLAALCAAGPGDPNVVSAVNFCHGYLMATGQFHAAITGQGGRVAPMFCLPSPRPTVSAITSGFVEWARANPQHANAPAVEGVVRYATAAYPCPPPPPAARRGRTTPRPQ